MQILLPIQFICTYRSTIHLAIYLGIVMHIFQERSPVNTFIFGILLKDKVYLIDTTDLSLLHGKVIAHKRRWVILIISLLGYRS